MSQDPEPLVLWKHEPKPQNPRSLKTWARIQNLWSSENMSQSLKNPWYFENMSWDPKIVGLWKHEPKPKKPLVHWKHEPSPKILGLWKHEPGSKTFGPLKTWAKIQNLWSSETHDQNLHIFLTSSKHVLYSFKEKKLHAWTTFGPDPPTKRYVGNLPRDSVRILIHYMIICIFIYMHHTFTTIKYWLQS